MKLEPDTFHNQQNITSKIPDSHLLTLIYDAVLEFLILTELGDPWETGRNTDHKF